MVRRKTQDTLKMNVRAVNAVMKYYALLSRKQEYKWVRWCAVRRRFSIDKANAFFLGVMLDQGQKAERAWDGASHFVENHFQGKGGLWKNILRSHHAVVAYKCKRGYEGQSYALNYCVNKFPRHVRAAARRMLKQYNGDPRRIWAVNPINVNLIYDRFVEFEGIGDALAKMAQFILVRNYGVAGGKKNQSKMSVKPDALVRRVLTRVGITQSEKISHAIAVLEELKIKRPADFDAALWLIGRDFCFKTNPACASCPLSETCITGNKWPRI